LDHYRLMLDFRRAKRAAQTEVDDCAGTGQKIDQVGHRVKHINRAIDAIAFKLWGDSEGVLMMVDGHMRGGEEKMASSFSSSKARTFRSLVKAVFTVNSLGKIGQKADDEVGKEAANIEIEMSAAEKEERKKEEEAKNEANRRAILAMAAHRMGKVEKQDSFLVAAKGRMAGKTITLLQAHVAKAQASQWGSPLTGNSQGDEESRRDSSILKATSSSINVSRTGSVANSVQQVGRCVAGFGMSVCVASMRALSFF